MKGESERERDRKTLRALLDPSGSLEYSTKTSFSTVVFKLKSGLYRWQDNMSCMLFKNKS